MFKPRPFTLIFISMIASGLVLTSHQKTQAQNFMGTNAAERLLDSSSVELEDQLINGLRATTPADRQYVEFIVNTVETGQIPRALVSVIYVWAIRKNPRIPLPYFRIALRVLAARRGVNLP